MSGINVEELRRQQQVMMERYMADVAAVSSGAQIGTWDPPAELKLAGCIFQRCGARNADGTMPPACAAAYGAARRLSALDAPKGMRPPVGFERDGDAGVYIFWFPDVWANVQAAESLRKRRKSVNAVDHFQAEMGKLGPSVEITSAGRKKR